MCFVWVVASFGGLAVFVLIVRKLFDSRTLPGGFRMPAIALELVRDEKQLEDLLREYPSWKAHKDLKMDLFVFIPVYVLLFGTLVYSLAWGGTLPYTPFLGIAVFLCIVGAALCDVVENLRTFAVLRTPNRAAVRRVRRAACIKWSLLFIAMALLAIPFAWQGGWFLIVATLYLAAAGVGALGLIRHPPLIEWAFALIGLALVPTGEALFAMVGKMLV